MGHVNFIYQPLSLLKLRGSLLSPRILPLEPKTMKNEGLNP